MNKVVGSDIGPVFYTHFYLLFILFLVLTGGSETEGPYFSSYAALLNPYLT